MHRQTDTTAVVIPSMIAIYVSDNYNPAVRAILLAKEILGNLAPRSTVIEFLDISPAQNALSLACLQNCAHAVVRFPCLQLRIEHPHHIKR